MLQKKSDKKQEEKVSRKSNTCPRKFMFVFHFSMIDEAIERRSVVVRFCGSTAKLFTPRLDPCANF